jgi:hypothetical protein
MLDSSLVCLLLEEKMFGNKPGNIFRRFILVFLAPINVSFLPIFGKYGWETTFPGYPYLENTARKQCFTQGYTLIQQT